MRRYAVANENNATPPLSGLNAFSAAPMIGDPVVHQAHRANAESLLGHIVNATRSEAAAAACDDEGVGDGMCSLSDVSAAGAGFLFGGTSWLISRSRAALTGSARRRNDRRQVKKKTRPDDTLSGRGVDRKRTLKDHGVSK